MTQLVFCDNSTPKTGAFNVYDDVKAKLLEAGIPKEEDVYKRQVSKEFHHGAKEGKWNGTKCR